MFSYENCTYEKRIFIHVRIILTITGSVTIESCFQQIAQRISSKSTSSNQFIHRNQLHRINSLDQHSSVVITLCDTRTLSSIFHSSYKLRHWVPCSSIFICCLLEYSCSTLIWFHITSRSRLKVLGISAVSFKSCVGYCLCRGREE